MFRLFFLLPCLLLLWHTATAQRTPAQDSPPEPVYRVKPLPELAASAVGLGATIYAFQVINDKDRINVADYDRADVPGFDRWAFPESFERAGEASAASDLGFYAGIGLPFALFVDPGARQEYFKVITMYFEAQAANGLLYAASPLGPLFIDRARPNVYYPEQFEDGTTDGGDRNGFFSGHVSTTATGTFFTAKVLSDFHPEWSGGTRALVYGLASLPPAYVSIQRVRALKHFPSDTVVGFAVGAALGILTPELHKRWQRRHRSSISVSGGLSDGAGALGLSMTF